MQMQKNLIRLKERVQLLSNHHQKFIRIIETHGERFIDRLETERRIEDVHLWKYAHDLSKEMDIVIDIAHDFKEKLIFLGTYHAFQILHLNFHYIDLLRFQLTRTDDRIAVYKSFLLEFGRQFRLLTSLYAQKIMDLCFAGNERPQFVFTSVGSLAHQDDIDVSIIDDGSPSRVELNRIVGILRQQMFKWATEMHLYISERVGTEFYSASIDEYRAILDKEISDFIIISEMLMAVPILGDRELFFKFQRKITNRYYFRRKQDNKFHEGYLRGILGEIRSLLIRQIDENILRPKDDALRMVTGLILSGRTIFRIHQGNRWDVLFQLRQRDPLRSNLYLQLEESLTIFEIFRHLYQLFIAQEEEIPLDDPDIIEQLNLVAKTLGYRDIGPIHAWDHLFIHYHENVRVAKKVADKLLGTVTNHLKMISQFTPVLSAASKPVANREYQGNLAIHLLKYFSLFRGAKFWDDVLEAINPGENHVLENFVRDLCSLKPNHRERIIRMYAETSAIVFFPIMALLVKLFQVRKKYTCEELFRKFNDSFLENAIKNEDRTPKILEIFRQFPELVHDYLKILKEREQTRFLSLVNDTLWSDEEMVYQKKLLNFCMLHFKNSHYFNRFFVRVIDHYPEYIHSLDDTEVLRQVTLGFLENIDNFPTFTEKKKQLNTYYDFEWLRVGIELITGTGIDEVNVNYTEFTDLYLQTLFEICRQRVIEEARENIPLGDLFAIYTSGGHGREQAFDDDYDILFLLNDDNPELRDFTRKIVIKMNGQIIRRGTMPHYRFADHFGDYITLVSDLETYFTQHKTNNFIDKSQILGSRLIVGSKKFEKDFENSIIKPHIFDCREEYILAMLKEMESRHQSLPVKKIGDMHVKECIGGLRDIEMILLIYKAHYCVPGPVNKEFIRTLAEEHHPGFSKLADALDFLKHIRDLYRLTVSADDNLNPKYLDRVAMVMGYQGLTAGEQLVKAYQDCTRGASEVIKLLIHDLNMWEIDERRSK